MVTRPPTFDGTKFMGGTLKKTYSQTAKFAKYVLIVLLLVACGLPQSKPVQDTQIPAHDQVDITPVVSEPLPVQDTSTPAPEQADITPVVPETGIKEATSEPPQETQETPEQLTQVGQWKLYEIVLTSTKSYSNPFTNVDVYADFSSGNNQLRVYGFHDGNGKGDQGNLWKIRFMTNEIGTWSWQTKSTDTGNQGLHNQTGQFRVVESNVPGPISPDSTYRNAWRHANGDFFYWTLGYSIHVLAADRTHPGVGGWQDYLNWLEAHKFNGVMFNLQSPSFRTCTTCLKGVAPWSAIGIHPPPEYARNLNDRVDYYIMPWADKSDVNQTAPNSSNADFSRFYLPLWHRADAVITEMQNKGMVAHVFAYDDETFWPSASSADERLYWDYIIRRLGAYWNVVYNDGIDLDEYRNLNTWVKEWQQYFQANDPFGHARSSRHGNDDAAYSTWRSVQAADSSRPRDIQQWRNLMNANPLKPVTEDDGIRARKETGISPDRFMQLAWWSVLSGPGGFGATWAGAYEPGNWYSNMSKDAEGMLRVSIRTRFISGEGVPNGHPIPFWKLAVRDDLVTGRNVYCSAVPGENYLVYFDFDSSSTTEINLKDAQHPLYVTWLNPYTGQTTSGGVITAPGNSHRFTKPFNGPAVLYLTTGFSTATPPLTEKIFIPLVRN
jgi:hypothetical protein